MSSIQLCIYMTKRSKDDIQESDPKFAEDVVNVIKKYISTFHQPPPIGIELYAYAHEYREVLTVHRVRFYSDGGFLIDIYYEDEHLAEKGETKHNWSIEENFIFEL